MMNVSRFITLVLLGCLKDPGGAPVSGAQVKAGNRDTNVAAKPVLRERVDEPV
jgi:hypothetical protein